jgi:hypothetical protein
MDRYIVGVRGSVEKNVQTAMFASKQTVLDPPIPAHPTPRTTQPTIGRIDDLIREAVRTIR